MRVSECNAADTPRERLLARGAKALSDAELLAVFLNNDVDAARKVLSTSGPLHALTQLRPDVLANIPGMSAVRACQVLAGMEIASRCMEASLERGEALVDPGVAGRYCAQRLRAHTVEVFAALFLDSRHRLIAFEELFQGTIDGAEVHPRVVVRRALELNAAAVILAHNHPSGNAEPSAADRAVTARLKQALTLVDVRLLDHFVIGDGPPTSLAARGWV